MAGGGCLLLPRILNQSDSPCCKTAISNLYVLLQICHTLSRWIRLRGMAPQSYHCTERSTGGSPKPCSIQNRALRISLHQWHYRTTLPSLAVRLTLLNCEDTISSRNSLNRFAILGTAYMTSSHLNVILQFLSDYGILRFIPSLWSEQNDTAPS